MRLLKTEWVPLVVSVVLPIPLIGLFAGTMKLALLKSSSGSQLNGSELAVPAMAVLFSLFSLNAIGFDLFREHGWNTWDRMRSNVSSTSEILVGKIVPIYTVAAIQFGLVFIAGAVVFDLRIRGSASLLVAVSLAFLASILALGMAVATVCRSAAQLAQVTNIATVVLGGLGGTFVPIEVLPHWARVLAPATPSYWAMRGLRGAILGGRIRASAAPLLCLVGFTVMYSLVAIVRFDVEEPKRL